MQKFTSLWRLIPWVSGGEVSIKSWLQPTGFITVPNFAKCRLNRTVVTNNARIQMERYVQDIATYRKLHNHQQLLKRERTRTALRMCVPCEFQRPRSFLVSSKNWTNVRLPLTKMLRFKGRDKLSFIPISSPGSSQTFKDKLVVILLEWPHAISWIFWDAREYQDVVSLPSDKMYTVEPLWYDKKRERWVSKLLGEGWRAPYCNEQRLYEFWSMWMTDAQISKEMSAGLRRKHQI